MPEDNQPNTPQANNPNSDNNANLNPQSKLAKFPISKDAEFKRQELIEAHRPTTDERLARFFEMAFRDISSLFKTIFGTDYESKNDFTFNQKRSILKYLYYKNNIDLQKPRIFTYLKVDIDENNKESLEKRNKYLQELLDYNRLCFICNLAQSQNRINYVGYIWGIFTSCIIWNLLPKDSSAIRKMALCGTIIHVSGKIAAFKSIDRIFDGAYPIFLKDLDNHLKEENENRELSILDKKKTDEISDFIQNQSKKMLEIASIKNKKYNNDMRLSKDQFKENI